MKYSVKLIIKYTVDTGDVFLEESILLLDADSFDEAYLKAEQYVADNGICETYTNIYGSAVKPEVVSYADCFSVYEDEVTEIYSSFIKPRDDLSADTIIASWEGSCSREELLPLRQWSDPERLDE